MPDTDLDQTFAQAIDHHHCGRLHEAEALYRKILTSPPANLNPSILAPVHNNLGNLHKQQGNLDDAIASFQRALELAPSVSQAHNNLGSALRDKGLLDESIHALRRAIALKPNFPEAHCNLGNVLKDKGQLTDAIAAYQHAISLRPDYAQAHSNLGNVLAETGQLPQAIEEFHQAFRLMPNEPSIHVNLGNALEQCGQFDQAAAAFRHAISLRPTLAPVYVNLSSVLKSLGQIDASIDACRQAIVLDAANPQAHCNLGAALMEQGRTIDAITSFTRAIELKPDFAIAHNNIGNALMDISRHQDAIAAFRRALSLEPDFPEALSNLGNALRETAQLDDAIAACRRAIALDPNFADAHNNLANAEKAQGQLDDAIASYRRAIALNPAHPNAHHNLLFTILYHPDFDARFIADEHQRWNLQIAVPLRRSRPFANDPSPQRRLKIGYVSPDFRDHVVGRNILPLLRNHDRAQYEITCYSHARRTDDMTSQFQQYADHWRDITALTDDQAADQIERDAIDILVDLTLHSGQNRLMIFARKPAPVQVTFAGYPGTTGLSAIDYRLSDPFLDPDGADDSIYSEKTIRLPHSFWCYDPLDCAGIPVNTLPAQTTGTFTFGCLNNASKINDQVLALWSRALREVPHSRLLLLSAPGSNRQRTLAKLTQCGIDPARIEFVSYQSRGKFLETFNRIDLSLDTFPYNGHTTSLDSFWMGVPVVTLIGNRAVARAGLCQLSNLGMEDLAAATPDDFVQIAAALANNLPRLSEIRPGLREKMEHSPLMNAPAFAKDIEGAYRAMWLTWCRDNS